MKKSMYKQLALAALVLAGNVVVAAPAWDPVAAGFYGAQTSSTTALRYFDYWKSTMTAPDCNAASIDRRHVSGHSLGRWQLGDVCLLPADVRAEASRLIGQAVSKDQSRLQEAQQKAKAEGKLKEWEEELNQKHLKMLRQGGGVGWVTEEFELAKDDKLMLEVSTFLPSSQRAYVSWIRRTVCAASKEQTLATDGAYFASLASLYGQPTQTVSESQFRAQQYEAKIADAIKLADKQEASARTDEERAAVKLLREEIRLLSKIKDSEKSVPLSASNPPFAHQWKFEDHIVSVNRSGECEGERPRYVLRLSIHGAGKSLFDDLAQASRAAAAKARDAAKGGK